MYTMMLGITSLGFFLNYLTSKRVANDNQTEIRKWALENTNISKGLGLAALIMGFSLHVIHLGFGSGSFAFLVTLMTAGSLIILLYPLNIINTKAFIAVCCSFLILELFI